VNVAALMAAPPGVVTLILAVAAPLGTVAVIVVAESTVKLAFTNPNVTLVVPMKPLPLIVTFVPAGPLAG
jgi:hypothetical protein